MPASRILAFCIPLLVAHAASAQAAPSTPSVALGEIDVRGQREISDPPLPGSAAYSAPSRAPLDATQPTSLVGPRFIERNVIPTQNYDSIIRYTPSVQNIEPTGPGLQQNFLQTIRGFTYKQFNSVFDGIVIPGTVSSFAPQSGAYFMAHDIGSVEVDRGPGTRPRSVMRRSAARFRSARSRLRTASRSRPMPRSAASMRIWRASSSIPGGSRGWAEHAASSIWRRWTATDI